MSVQTLLNPNAENWADIYANEINCQSISTSEQSFIRMSSNTVGVTGFTTYNVQFVTTIQTRGTDIVYNPATTLFTVTPGIYNAVGQVFWLGATGSTDNVSSNITILQNGGLGNVTALMVNNASDNIDFEATSTMLFTSPGTIQFTLFNKESGGLKYAQCTGIITKLS